MNTAIVVGGGIFGLSIALGLQETGWKVTLIEEHEPGHTNQASAGESRFLRCSHGNDTWYAQLAWQAREQWLALQHDVGEELFVPCGVLWFAYQRDGWEAESARTLTALGIPCDALEAHEARALFPDLFIDDLAMVVREPGAGMLRARRAVRALARRANVRGVQIIAARARPAGPVVAVDGALLRADRIVWACGAWLPGLFPDLLDIRTSQQDVLYFDVPTPWSTPPIPGWIDLDAATYGCGNLDANGMKLTSDAEGKPYDPDAAQQRPSKAASRRARAYLRHRFPALADAPVTHTEICHYDLTVDGNWLLAPHPEHPHVWLAGGGSGHGFKHGPAFGRYVTSILEGREPEHQRFALYGRSNDAAPRPAGTIKPTNEK